MDLLSSERMCSQNGVFNIKSTLTPFIPVSYIMSLDVSHNQPLQVLHTSSNLLRFDHSNIKLLPTPL